MKNWLFIFGISLLVPSVIATKALAWGDEGHEIVGLIAEHELANSPAVLAKIHDLLAADTSGIVRRDTGDLMADEATWADRYRDMNQRRSHYTATRNWHFVDLEIDSPSMNEACSGQKQLPQGTAASAGPANDCVVDKIEQFQEELSSSATASAERLMALQFLLHFVGDLHQPLHSSDRNDQGGNGKTVSAPGFNQGKLHGYWDTEFVQQLGTDPQAVAANLEASITPADRIEWTKGTVESWAMESFSAAKTVAYGRLPQPDPNGTFELSADYVGATRPIVSTQLSKAGVRLAAILKRALGN